MNKIYLDKSKYYESLKKLLITAGYPEIKYKDIEYVKTLLSKQNRILLLTWAYLQISDDVDLLDDNEPILESFLQENGFCRSNEIENFITGSNIKASKEFKIFERILFFIACNKQFFNTSEETKDAKLFTPETLADIVKRKHNVLPTYIVSKKLSEEEKQILYNDLSNENDDLEEKIRKLETQSLNEDLFTLEIKNIENVDQILSDFKDNKEIENFISNFTLVRNMNKLSDDSQNVNQLIRQSEIIHESLTHINNLFKMLEATQFLKQLKENVQLHCATKTENDVNTENIQILEKTLAILKEYGKQ